MDQSIFWLEQIEPSQRLFVGDKALILSQLLQQGFPVVPGFVIGAGAFHQFLQQLDDPDCLLADFPASSLYLDVDNPQALQLVARQSRQAILRKPFSVEWLSALGEAGTQLKTQFLILRASITHPGETVAEDTPLLRSQVCLNRPEQLELSLKTLWAELFSSKSLFYWQRIGVGLEKINLAVLVQPLTNAIASGIAQIEPEYFIVEGSWGLGHSLLFGEVLPDRYRIEASTGRIETQELGNKTRAYRLRDQSVSVSTLENCLESYLLSQEEQENYCLTEAFLVKLTEMLQNLQIKSSCIEWTLTQLAQDTQPQFYLVQSKLNQDKIFSDAISTFAPNMTDSQPILTGLSASPGIIYAQAYVLTETNSSLKTIPEGHILVAKSIVPDWLPWIKKTVGIIAEEGGITSHAAIIARELGIPAIVGAKGATQLLKTGKSIQLDGDQGTIYLTENKVPQSDNIPTEDIKLSSQLVTFNYPIGTQLMVNLSQLSSLNYALTLPVDGIGLLRSELMLLELLAQQSLKEWLHPAQQSLFVRQWSKIISQFARNFAPRPVFYRSLDWIGNLEDRPDSDRQFFRSFLGKRGTYTYHLDTSLFDLELQALEQVYQSDNINLKLILPFVRSLEEFKFCHHRIEQTDLIQKQSFQLWIMAEVPSVIFLLPQYIEAGVQGIAIGTNDLTQLLLGVDREEGKLGQDYNATHPAMLAALKQLITQAKAGGIPCSICGQAPVQYPQLIDHLINWGITSISVEPEAVEKIYRAIARAEQRLILNQSRIN
ncbi:PEP-utilising protein mobile region [Gloeothece citriformis PCC 7424]|uniref:Phosphoenolpyruvate synthase n=1 Tax=Gloeothece citriformis (strain PCC 7424) TaxID=65393 RepID=B7KDV0_GLOC7|nr:putative PEP-binding protein [Gloeothece citriformis]ACK70402.1 PEP-utilising protein mobile region [Gloeothece citriformis PCC 7424]